MTGTARPAHRTPAAYTSRYTWLLAPASMVIGVDQLTKWAVTGTLRDHPIDLVDGAVRLLYTRNTGAAFSILAGGGVLFAVVALAVSVGIILYYPRAAGGPLLVRLGLAFILGGAIGNLVDRMRLGYVVDFIDLRWWPVFNLADSAVVIGVAALVLQSFLPGRRTVA